MNNVSAGDDDSVEAERVAEPQGFRRPPRKSDVLIGAGGWLKGLYDQITMVAPTEITVAISGESGTGKELVARTIHNQSPRHGKRFVAVNCAAIPEALLEGELFGHMKGAFTDASSDRDGLLAAADGGTLFLDEIGEMPLSIQVKLLRFLQSKEFRRLGADSDTQVDVRVITATNKNLEQLVQSGEFREDLFYRIQVFPLVLPPLRERPEDIPMLAQHFLLKHRTRMGKAIDGFSPAAIKALVTLDYRGNVRELENVVSRGLVMAQGPLVEAQDLLTTPSANVHGFDFDIARPFRELKQEVVGTFERAYLQRLLTAHAGNIAAAARQAAMDRKNLWALLKKHDMNAEDYRS